MQLLSKLHSSGDSNSDSLFGSDESELGLKESLSFSQLSGPTHLINKSLRFSGSEWSTCVQMELLNSVHSARPSDSNDSKSLILMGEGLVSTQVRKRGIEFIVAC